jgi:hypothetical protein
MTQKGSLLDIAVKEALYRSEIYLSKAISRFVMLLLQRPLLTHKRYQETLQ